MDVRCLADLDQLAPHADHWDRLSGGVPFRSWAWLSAWWRHYGWDAGNGRRRIRLFIPCVFDQGQLVGIAPWYLDSGGPWGRVVRWLGSGEVCSEYLGLMCHAAVEDQVAEALADYLSEARPSRSPDPGGWDLLELGQVDAQDTATARLIEHLAEQANTVHRHPGANCWRIELPGTWDEYLAMLSKSHRKQARRLGRSMLQSGRAVLHPVRQAHELPRAIDLLVDLHQRRRRALGEPGCFASARFAAFHREVMPQLLSAGQLKLYWLELDGKPVAAEYQLAGGGVIYAYQSGMDPDAVDHQPGKLITWATLQRAIEQGWRAFDFLRGDEPYKAHFRARSRAALSVRVVPDRTSARLRHGLWVAGKNVKRWIKQGLKPA